MSETFSNMSNKDSVKFKTIYKKRRPLEFLDISELNNWRQILYRRSLIGQNREKYGGIAYGNLSQRLVPYDSPMNERSFIITGSGTGSLENLIRKNYSIVLEYYPENNMVVVEKGSINASSESMTHGTIYDLDESARFVFHVHSGEIWKNAKKLGIQITGANVEYGTLEIADEVSRLFEETNVKDSKIFSMGGHEDGIISFGTTAREAGSILLKYLSKFRKKFES